MEPRRYVREEEQVLPLFDGMTRPSHTTAALAGANGEADPLSPTVDSWALLVEATLDLAADPHLPALAPAILARAMALIGAAGAALGLYDPMHAEVELTAQIGAALPIAARQRLGEGLFGRIAATQSPQFGELQSAAVDQPAGSGQPSLRRAGLGVPLLYQGSLVGVLCVYADTTAQRRFTAADLRLLSLFAGAAAIALHNARLLAQARRRAAVEQVVATIATRFVRVESGQVEREINDTLRVAGEFVGVDRAYLFQMAADGQTMDNTHEWCGPGVAPRRAHLQGVVITSLPWSMEQLTHAQATYARHLDDLPDAAAAEKAVLIAMGIHSFAVIPLLSSTRLIGLMGFETMQRERAWDAQDIALLTLVGEVFVLALDRVHADATLRQREQELAWLVEESPDIVIRFDRDLRYQYVNPTGTRFAQKPLHEFLGKTPPEIGYGLDNAFLEQVMQARELFTFERVVYGEAGNVRHLQWRFVPEVDEHSQVKSLLAVGHDVTDLKRVQIELEQLNHELEVRVAQRTAELATANVELQRVLQQYRTLVDNSLQAVVIYQGARIVFANAAMTAISGYSVEELLALAPEAVANAIHPEDRPLIFPGTIYPAEGPETRSLLQLRLIHKDGTVRWVISAAMQVTYRGEPARQAVLVDITELKRAEESLLESQHFVDQITETSPNFIFVYDIDQHRDIYINPAARLFLGYSTVELAALGGGFLAAIVHPDDLPVAMAKFSQYHDLHDDEFIEQEVRVRGAMGDWHWLLMRESVFKRRLDGRPAQVLGVSMDITALKHSERAMRSALAKERELNELKSRFVSMASHEFRTPLATILAAAETLFAYRHQLDEQQTDLRLQRIRRQVKHLSQIIDDVLDMTHVQSGRITVKMEMTDLDAFCREIVEEFQSRFDIAHDFDYRGGGAPLLVAIDRKLMRTVVDNLLSNAIKYSPKDSVVTIGVTCVDALVQIQVTDTGIGIPLADQEHLFESFYRASNVGATAGTGLGLSIAKEFVELHSGQLTYATAVGEGTTFIVTIPAVR